MLVAYLDESGTHGDASAVIVGGYVSTAEQWEAFRTEWSVFLATESVKILHRADLENFQGEFERGKGWDETRRLTNQSLV